MRGAGRAPVPASIRRAPPRRRRGAARPAGEGSGTAVSWIANSTSATHSSAPTARWATISQACSPAHTFTAPEQHLHQHDADDGEAQPRERGRRAGVEAAALAQHDREQRQQHRDRDVHERAVREVDVERLAAAERQELAAAGRELVAAGHVRVDGAVLLARAVQLARRHVAAGHDRREHGDERHRRQDPDRARAAELQRADRVRPAKPRPSAARARSAASRRRGASRPAPPRAPSRRSARRAPPGTGSARTPRC